MAVELGYNKLDLDGKVKTYMTLLGKTAIRFADEWISLASLR